MRLFTKREKRDGGGENESKEKKTECLKENDDVTNGEKKRCRSFKKESVCLYNVCYVMYDRRYTGRSFAILFAHEYTHIHRQSQRDGYEVKNKRDKHFNV